MQYRLQSAGTEKEEAGRPRDAFAELTLFFFFFRSSSTVVLMEALVAGFLISVGTGRSNRLGPVAVCGGLKPIPQSTQWIGLGDCVAWVRVPLIVVPHPHTTQCQLRPSSVLLSWPYFFARIQISDCNILQVNHPLSLLDPSSSFFPLISCN